MLQLAVLGLLWAGGSLAQQNHAAHGFSYIGCMDVTTSAAHEIPLNPQDCTPEACQGACVGYQYAAVYPKTCKCYNSIGSQTPMGDDQCNNWCDNNSALGRCGSRDNSGYSNVYGCEVPQSRPAPTQPTTTVVIPPYSPAPQPQPQPSPQGYTSMSCMTVVNTPQPFTSTYVSTPLPFTSTITSTIVSTPKAVTSTVVSTPVVLTSTSCVEVVSTQWPAPAGPTSWPSTTWRSTTWSSHPGYSTPPAAPPGYGSPGQQPGPQGTTVVGGTTSVIQGTPGGYGTGYTSTMSGTWTSTWTASGTHTTGTHTAQAGAGEVRVGLLAVLLGAGAAVL